MEKIKVYHGTKKGSDIIRTGRIYSESFMDAHLKSDEEIEKMTEELFGIYDELTRMLAGLFRDLGKKNQLDVDQVLYKPDVSDEFCAEVIVFSHLNLSLGIPHIAKYYAEQRDKLFVWTTEDYIHASNHTGIGRELKGDERSAVFELSVPVEQRRPESYWNQDSVFIKRWISLQCCSNIYVQENLVKQVKSLAKESGIEAVVQPFRVDRK